MQTARGLEEATRGYKKRRRTRRLLVEAGLEVLAEKGEALTVSDVTSAAGVANGTFYNYFSDREALLDALATDLLVRLTEGAASEPIADPAERFAVASARVLRRASEDPTWGRVVMRLFDRPSVHSNIDQYLRADLDAGFASGRFDTGADDATIDQVLGLLLMSIRRIVEGEGHAQTPARAVERGLRALGVEASEARALAEAAVRA